MRVATLPFIVARRSSSGRRVTPWPVGRYLRFALLPAVGLPRFAGTGRLLWLRHRALRRIPPCPGPRGGDLDTPDIILLLSEIAAVVDNLSGKLTLVVYAEPGCPGLYARARAG